MLVMPFVVVASRGGRWDDEAYCAGYEMGTLNAALAQRPARLLMTLQDGNQDQADLVAMRHGYRCTVAGHDDQWVHMQFVRAGQVDRVGGARWPTSS
jgi:hypothetical protein